ncbi:importin-4-like [Venturia canescens]|uniref:importin-4-like n=1 Tax=Venturia canescens TaxID=32260 RepID=UPI001C9BCBBE|nr:importin-4-like [Venturia canescens]
MEDILGRLLVADTNVVEQATSELREIFKKPESSSQLFQLMIASQKPMIRQYAAILLKERYSKVKNWGKLPVDVRTQAKQLIIQGLSQETEKNVRNAIAQLMGVIVRHELPSNGWPQIFEIIQELSSSEDLSKKELGMYTLAKITEISPDAYIGHAQSIMTLLAQVMQSLGEMGTMTAFYILQTMLNLVPLVDGNPMMVNLYHQMMGPAMSVVQALATTNEDRAIEALELFDELCDETINVFGSRTKDLIAMCLDIAKNVSLGDELRSRAISLLRTLIRTRKRTILKHKLVEPIVDVLYGLMSAKLDEDEDEELFDDENEKQTPSIRAAHTMHLLGLHLQPEKLFPHLLRCIKPGLDGNDVYAKKAAYLTMAVLTEGCSEFIRKNYLPDFLQYVLSAVMHDNPIVCNAALYAAGKFAEFLQPDISRFSDQLMPVLYHYLDRVYECGKEGVDLPKGVMQMFYALETFCENLEDALLPELPELMRRLIDYLNKGTSLQIRGLVFSAIGAAANASKQNMLPYFPDIMRHLDAHLAEPPTEETMSLQIQAIETLGILIRSVGSENLTAVIGRFLEFGLNLLQNTNDPDIRKVVYGLFASISTVMKKDMAPALPKIVEHILESIRSTEGVVTRYKDEDVAVLFPIYDDGSDNEEGEEDIEDTDDEEDLDDDDVAGYRVNSAYVEEKEEAILALKEIAQYTEEAFLPYLEKSFEETLRVTSYPQMDIREASIDALMQFCLNLSKISTNECRDALLKALSVFVPKLSELIRLDCERSVAMNGLGAYATMLKEIKGDVLLGEGHRDAIINCVTDVMFEKTECQEQEDDVVGEDCENEAEEDEALIEYAGDVFSALGKVIPPEDFAMYFQAVLPILSERCKSNKSEAQKSFAIGTIAECISGLKHTSGAFVEQLLPLFHKCSSDESPDVRNNAFYGLGELILHSKEAMYSHYSNVLSLIIVASAREVEAGPRDNMVGVIARMIIANYAILDIDQVFPSFLKQLPLQQDFVEYQAVFDAVLTLYRAGHEIVKPHLQDLLTLAINVLHEDKAPSDETKETIMGFVKSVNQDFVDIYNAVYSQLSPEVSSNMMRIFS